MGLTVKGLGFGVLSFGFSGLGLDASSILARVSGFEVQLQLWQVPAVLRGFGIFCVLGL